MAITISEAIQRTVEHREIFADEMTSLWMDLMTGKLTPAQIAGLIVGLRVKKETIGEITAAAKVMRDLSTKVNVRDPESLLDIVGTGGDGARTFNISTTSMFVIAAAGGRVTGVKTESGPIPADCVILATGGLSYPATGSTGDGYRFAQRLGHTVTPTRASLVPLESEDPWCAEMQGFSLRNVTLTVYDEQNKAVYSDLGEMLFTHFGVSGPLVLSASAHMHDFSRHKYRLSIDLKPALDEKKLDARILRDFQKYANRDFKNALYDLAGHAMIPVLVRLSGIPEDTKVNVITREQRHKLVQLFKHFPVSVTGTRPIDEAIITSGGVSLKEVNPRTMGSKLVHGLYFAGEVLDLDAYTGGFNLQIAWSTGYVAGNAACT